MSSFGKFKKKGLDVSWLPLAMVGGGLDPAVASWVSAVVTAGGTVSSTQQTNVNTLVLNLKSNSLWTKFDRLWLFASENTQQAGIDLIGHNTLVSTNSSTFVASSGYKGLSSANWIDTGFIPASSGVNWVPANSTCMGIYGTHITGGAVTHMGSLTSGGSGCLLQCNAFSLDIGSQNGGICSVTPTTPGGLYTVTRTATNAVALYKNASSTPIASNTGTASSISTFSLYVLASNNAGVVSQKCGNDTIGIVFIGGALASTDIPNLSSCLNGYMTALGTNVY